MALPVPPVNPSNPIPNNPFYYPEGSFLQGPTGPLIVGSGFSINNATGTLNVSGTGSSPTILAGAGIAITAGVGTVTITNSGIRTVTAGAGIAVTVAGGNLQITNTLPSPVSFGTVTQVDAGFGLIGGPITTTGSLALAPVATVAPGTYSNPTITVDNYGRITYAAPGPGSLGSLIQATAPLSVNASIPQTISINNASTAFPGAVQLNNSISSTSMTQAATPSAVKQAYDVASAASFDAATALVSSSSAITAASTAQTTANTAQATALAAQSAVVTAQNTANTAIANANAAQVTANAAIPRSAFATKGQLLTGIGTGSYFALNPGSDGQVLVACSSCVSGLTWAPGVSGTFTFGTCTVVITNGLITSVT